MNERIAYVLRGSELREPKAVVVPVAAYVEPVGLDVPGGRRALPWTELLGPRRISCNGDRTPVREVIATRNL